MTAYTDDDVAAGAEAVARWYDQDYIGYGSDEVAIAERVLAAAAPAIAARALREASDDLPLNWTPYELRDWLGARAKAVSDG